MASSNRSTDSGRSDRGEEEEDDDDGGSNSDSDVGDDVHVHAHVIAAKAYINDGDYIQASRECKHALKLLPPTPPPPPPQPQPQPQPHSTGSQQQQQHTERRPDAGVAAVVWNILAGCYLFTKQYGEAISAASMALRFDGKSTESYFILARCHQMVYRLNEAKEFTERGLLVSPNHDELLDCQREISDVIDTRRRDFTTTLLQPPGAGNYVYFGGDCGVGDSGSGSGATGTGDGTDDTATTTTKNDKVLLDTWQQDSSFSYYTGLPRPAKSPFMSRQWNLASNNENGEFDDVSTHVFDVFCNQDLLVKWTANDSLCEIEAYIPGDCGCDGGGNDEDGSNNNDATPVLVHSLVSNPHDPEQSGEFSISDLNEKYSKSLTVDQTNSLKLILLSRFLRSMGSVLPERWFFVCCNHGLTLRLRSSKRYKDVLDTDIIKCDVMINHHRVALISLNGLGESLEAAKKYNEAGMLYRGLAEGKFGQIWQFGDDGHPDVAAKMYLFHSNAGLAFKRGMDYISAQEQYLAAIRKSTDVDVMFNIGDGNHLRTNLVQFYHTAADDIANGLVSKDDAHLDILRCNGLIIALFTAVGIDLSTHTDVSPMYIRTVKNCMLKKPYRKAAKARKALKDAFTTESTADFHSRLFSYRDAKAPNSFAQVLGISKEEFLKSRNKRSKEMARSDAHSVGLGASLVFDRDRCAHPQCGAMGEEFMVCPCQKAAYCSRGCQVAHYPVHKTICTVRGKSSSKQNKK